MWLETKCSEPVASRTEVLIKWYQKKKAITFWTTKKIDYLSYSDLAPSLKVHVCVQGGFSLTSLLDFPDQNHRREKSFPHRRSHRI